MFDNRKQSIPKLFVEIMANHKKERELRQQNPVDFQEFKENFQERRRFRIAAEDFLRRKGNTGGTF